MVYGIQIQRDAGQLWLRVFSEFNEMCPRVEWEMILAPKDIVVVVTPELKASADFDGHVSIIMEGVK